VLRVDAFTNSLANFRLFHFYPPDISHVYEKGILTLENVYNYVSMTLVTLLNFVENVSEYV